MAVEIKHIIKRDGSVKDFDVHKIVYAIECAGKATNQFGRERAEAWRNTYSLVLTGEGLALLPVTLLLVYFDMDFETLTVSFVAVIAVAKLLLTWQTYRLFFGTPLGCVHLFLYFCGLEILPLALLWRALVFLSQYLITIT